MRRSVIVAVTVTVLAAAGAVTCHLRAAKLRSEGDWLMARGNAQAEEYAQTLDGAFADQQLASFDARRDALERAHLWQRFQMLLVMVAVLGAFCTYVLRVLGKIRTEIDEVTGAPLTGDTPIP